MDHHISPANDIELQCLHTCERMMCAIERLRAIEEQLPNRDLVDWYRLGTIDKMKRYAISAYRLDKTTNWRTPSWQSSSWWLSGHSYKYCRQYIEQASIMTEQFDLVPLLICVSLPLWQTRKRRKAWTNTLLHPISEIQNLDAILMYATSDLSEDPISQTSFILLLNHMLA